MSKFHTLGKKFSHKRIISVFLLGITICISTNLYLFPNVLADEEGNSTIPEMAEEFIYSTFFGGNGEEAVLELIFDSEGNIIISGWTSSTNLETVDGYQMAFGGGFDIFLFKYTPDLIPIWGTYLGDTGWDYITEIAVDSNDNIYGAGVSNSLNFPTTDDAVQSNFAGGENDGIFFKFSPDGDMLYSTYIGGSDLDTIEGLSINLNNEPIIVGETKSTDLNVTDNALQSTCQGDSDVFLVKFNPDYSELQMLTYWGSSNIEEYVEITTDQENSIIISGATSGSNFPTKNPYQSEKKFGEADIFITKFSNDFNLSFSTYLGGNRRDLSYDITTDTENRIYIGGTTKSDDFPLFNPTQSINNGNWDAIFVQLSADGQELLYSSYFGSSAVDYFQSISVTHDGDFLLTGGGDKFFPLKHALVDTVDYGEHPVFMQLASNFSIEFSSFLGNIQNTNTHCIIASLTNDIFITGLTSSSDFYISSNATKDHRSGSADGFIFRFDQKGYLQALSEQKNNPIIGIESSSYYIVGFSVLTTLIITKKLRKTKLSG